MAQLIGLVYREAKIQKTDNGKTFMVFTFVEKDSYKDKDDKRVTQNTYFNCIMWNADNLAPYLKKGVQLVINGNITPHLYTDGHGKSKAGVNVSVTNLSFIPTSKPTASEEEKLTTESEGEGVE